MAPGLTFPAGVGGNIVIIGGGGGAFIFPVAIVGPAAAAAPWLATVGALAGAVALAAAAVPLLGDTLPLGGVPVFVIFFFNLMPRL